jgi:hypothetical protein
MNTVLLSAGAACVIAAVVGGGLKAFEIEVPVISNFGRQVLLFVVGLGFLASAYVLRDRASGPDEATTAYRQLAAASCQRIVKIRTAGIPIDEIDLTPTGPRFHKTPLVQDLRRRQSGMQAELASLWARKPPESLEPQQRTAKEVSAEWLRRFGDTIRAVEASAPDPVTQADLNGLDQSGDAGLRARANDAMTALAAQDCSIAG